MSEDFQVNTENLGEISEGNNESPQIEKSNLEDQDQKIKKNNYFENTEANSHSQSLQQSNQQKPDLLVEVPYNTMDPTPQTGFLPSPQMMTQAISNEIGNNQSNEQPIVQDNKERIQNVYNLTNDNHLIYLGNNNSPCFDLPMHQNIPINIMSGFQDNQDVNIIQKENLDNLEEEFENIYQDVFQKIKNEEDFINQQEALKHTPTILSLRNVHKTYLLGLEGVAALRGVTVKINQGEFILIYGTSGCGKSTMLNIMGTIDIPTKGEVSIFDNKIRSKTKDKLLANLRLSYFGFVFQNFNLIPSLNALENVSLPMILKGELTQSQIKKRAIELLESVGLGQRIKHLPNQLSGGEQQRVTIARSLANNPKLLFLDEPTGDLDSKNSELVMKILLQLNLEKQITLVMVTHEQAHKPYANRIIHMFDGKIKQIDENDPISRQKAIYDLYTNQQNKKNLMLQNLEKQEKTEIKPPTAYPLVEFMKRIQNQQNAN